MAIPIEFYFDFMSPFAYLAHARVAELADEFGRDVRYRPIDLTAAKIAAGNTGPSNREIPTKLRYLLTDINRWAERAQLPVSFPASLDSHRMNVGTFYAIERNEQRAYITAGFNIGWGQGADIGADATLATLAESMGWSAKIFLEYVSEPQLNLAYQASNLNAHQRGVFGVPTTVIGDEMWWGNDRLHFVEEFLRHCHASI
jgi:2-hydroxychromene-2-carboxylate isomerase